MEKRENTVVTEMVLHRVWVHNSKKKKSKKEKQKENQGDNTCLVGELEFFTWLLMC